MARRGQDTGQDAGGADRRARRYGEDEEDGQDGQGVQGEGARALEGGEELTRRERDVLRLLSEGWRPRQIAERLTISVETARTHIKHVCGKLGVSGMLGAVAQARRLGLLGEPAAPPTPSPTQGGVPHPLPPPHCGGEGRTSSPTPFAALTARSARTSSLPTARAVP